MTRRYGDLIEVRGAGEIQSLDVSSAGFTPEQFLWRGRLYVVRAVLAQWIEMGTWWVQSTRVGASPGLPTHDVGAERRVWRVEAAAGRSGTCGVYDLCHEPDRGSSAVITRQWRLARTLD